MRVLVQVGLVALGSAFGGAIRWGVGVAIARLFGTAFPWGTFFINVSGCLFLGWFSTWLSERLLGGSSWLDADGLRLMIAVGFTGGYTTFSTFEYEAHRMLSEDNILYGLLYIVASVLLGLLAMRCGILLARW